MKILNERFGVVDVVARENYEKLYQIPYGYAFMSFSEKGAIRFCKESKNENFIVEKIYDTSTGGNNLKEEIYRFMIEVYRGD